MTVYVDEVRRYPSGQWSHLSADSLTELRAFARRLGLRPEWEQRGHFDVRPSIRRLALSLGASPITARQMVEVRKCCEAHP